MPAGPGESLLATLYADIHYFFTPPSSKPVHHRFDRGSYVYLYHNAAQQQAKLEVANHAGTPEQDSFHGFFHAAQVRYSHLQPGLVSLSVDANAVPDHSTWHLPAYNEKNEQKYLYKLNAIDVYFWTEKDATTFMTHLKKIVSADRLEIKNAPATSNPHAEHRDSMSPVVQQLERTAIGSSYQQHRTASTVSAQSFPGPPPSSASGRDSPYVPQAAPAAYNPAAPAAPEPVTYREKTPPPQDGGSGTGLNHAAKYENAPPPQFNSTSQYPSFSGPPQQQSPLSGQSFPGPPSHAASPPPPQQQQQRAPSFGPMAQSTLPQSPPPHQQTFQRSATFAGTPSQMQHATYNPQANNALNYNQPLQSPALPPPPPLPQHQQQQHQQQQQQHHQNVPIGGYSDYNYATPGSQPHGMYANANDIHSQTYRPTEAEHGSHKPRPTAPNAEGKPFGNLEGKVGKYLNKLDKLW